MAGATLSIPSGYGKHAELGLAEFRFYKSSYVRFLSWTDDDDDAVYFVIGLDDRTGAPSVSCDISPGTLVDESLELRTLRIMTVTGTAYAKTTGNRIFHRETYIGPYAKWKVLAVVDNDLSRCGNTNCVRSNKNRETRCQVAKPKSSSVPNEPTGVWSIRPAPGQFS